MDSEELNFDPTEIAFGLFEQCIDDLKEGDRIVGSATVFIYENDGIEGATFLYQGRPLQIIGALEKAKLTVLTDLEECSEE
ncbi:MAG: hypothetical protein WC476_00840 [Phycisphaerae bacterium]|jgi:hypothetical protein